VSASRPLVWRKTIVESTLDPIARLVAHTLSVYLNSKGVAYPSRGELAAGSGLGVRTVDRALRRLEAAGFLDVERTRGGGYGENKNTNRYRVTLPVTASERRRDEWPDEKVTASERSSHGVREVESQCRQRHTKTFKTSKTTALDAAGVVVDATASAEPENPAEGRAELLSVVDVLRAAAAGNLPLDDCTECGRRLPLVNSVVCIPCAACLAAADISDDLRGSVDLGRDGRR